MGSRLGETVVRRAALRHRANRRARLVVALALIVALASLTLAQIMRAAPSRAHVVCGAVGGGVFGAVISVVVNNALIEISLTPFFASVFGCVLMLLGVLMCWRKLWEDHQHPLMRLLVLAFSGLVLLSAVSCFLLEKDWFRTIPPNAKVPLYMSLGVSLSFAVTFSLVDLLNLYSDHCRSRAVPLVASSRQIGLVLLGAVAMGALFGFMFGAMDVEDDGAAHEKLRNEERASLPIGFALGAVVGGGSILLAEDPGGRLRLDDAYDMAV